MLRTKRMQIRPIRYIRLIRFKLSKAVLAVSSAKRRFRT